VGAAVYWIDAGIFECRLHADEVAIGVKSLGTACSQSPYDEKVRRAATNKADRKGNKIPSLVPQRLSRHSASH
jgi:hypothetical protein